MVASDALVSSESPGLSCELGGMILSRRSIEAVAESIAAFQSSSFRWHAAMLLRRTAIS